MLHRIQIFKLPELVALNFEDFYLKSDDNCVSMNIQIKRKQTKNEIQDHIKLKYFSIIDESLPVTLLYHRSCANHTFL